MNCRRRKIVVWAATIYLLLLMVVLSVPASAQVATSDAKSDTATPHKKHHRKKLTLTDSAAPASTASPLAGAVSTQETKPPGNPPNKTREAPGNSSPEVAAAQASGKVWVNLDSGIYHKNGRWYGKTKNGKFMTEAEAKAAGYKPSRKN